MILLVNQHTVPIFIDVVNAFAKEGEETRLFAGYVEQGRVPFEPLVKTVHSVAYNRKSTATRFSTWMMFSCHYFFYLLFCKKPSCIIVVTNPPMAPFVTAVVARIRRIPFYIVVFDLYPEALSQAGISGDNGMIFKMWQSNNRWTFSKARGLITLSDSMKHVVTKYTDASKVKVIFNWADTDHIKPVDKQLNPFVSKHQLTGKLVVMYSGNMGFTHDLESLMQAASILIGDSRIKFVLIGEGGKRDKLKRIKIEKKLDNVIFLPFQDPEEFPNAMAAADIGIVTLGTGGEGISVPSKTYVNMAAGLAIIAISPEHSELNRIVGQYSIGYSVAPGQPAQVAQYISSLADNPAELAALKSQARSAAMSFTPANAGQYVSHVLGR
jgi:glycosyltransferase involved in cell wall biosynthesis